MISNMIKKLKSENGVTGQDLVIALFILAMSLTFLLTVYSNIRSLSYEMRMNARAHDVATKIAEQLDSLEYDDDFFYKTRSNINEEVAENFGITDLNPDIYKINISVNKLKYDEFKADFDIVKEKYLNEKKSIRMIASELGLPPTRIRQILMQAGVKRRDQSESHLIYNDGYKEFSIDWSLMEDDLLKRCRHYFSNHIASTIEKVQCEDCDATEHLHIHHIKSLSLIVQEIKDENPNKTEDELYNIIIHDNRFLSKDNLKVVCEDCHYTKYHSYLGYKKKNNQIVNQQPSLSNKEGSTTIESIVRE